MQLRTSFKRHQVRQANTIKIKTSKKLNQNPLLVQMGFNGDASDLQKFKEVFNIQEDLN